MSVRERRARGLTAKGSHLSERCRDGRDLNGDAGTSDLPRLHVIRRGEDQVVEVGDRIRHAVGIRRPTTPATEVVIAVSGSSRHHH